MPVILAQILTRCKKQTEPKFLLTCTATQATDRKTMNPFTLYQDDGSSDPQYGATLESVKASIARPPCECDDCQNGFYTVKEQYIPGLSYRRRLSDKEAERRVLSAGENIHRRQASLTERINIYGDVLLSRWKKRSQAKREALLKEAAPELEEDQWFLPRYTYLRERLYIHARSPTRRRQLLLPWLNVQVMKTNPAVLFALLHYRTAYSPQHWAAFDSRQLTLGWAAGFFDVDFSAKCVVMYGDQYGSLVDWEEKAAHRADTLGFPRAMLVLEAQAYLMEVLCSIVGRILDGVDPSQPPRVDKWRELVSHDAFRQTGVVEFWSPYTNQAFSKPPEFDSNYLLTLAKTRLDETRDHLWYLQCDAAYMRRHLKTMFATEIFKKASESHRAVLLAQRIRTEILNHHWWRWIEMECKHVDTERKRFRDNVYSGTPLPIRYDKALGALELLLVNQVIYRASRLEELLPFVPGLQKHWSLEPEANLPNTIGFLKREASVNTQEALTEDPLDWCLVQLQAKPDDQRAFDHAMLFAMLQDHLSSNPSEKKRLDEIIYQTLSDLSTCHEMLLAVRFHRPQNAARTLQEVSTTEDREFWKPRRSESYKEDLGLLQGIGTSLIRDFYLAKPPTGPRNADWLARSRVLRTALEKFWESIRGTVREEFRSSAYSPAEVDSLLEVVSANLSAEYLQQEQQAEAEILTAIRRVEEPQAVAGFFYEAEPRPVPSTIVTRREKAKTRGGQGTSAGDTIELGDKAASAHGEPTELTKGTAIEVTRQSLGVFQLMFPNRDDVVKDVLWDRFVHAMIDAGFTARNNSGSAVAFKQLSGEGGRIVFHKPHPVDKIDPVLLRIMGKRMERWFGWRRELFVLRDEII
ncbi:hypothetical protein QSH57_004835 [Fusarium oxysporum f. sp. vasinfectum]|nr:hypothetical protein QSH57_004835 [Fusarium oxysporum f. sp. vasinfectum]